MLCSMLLAIVLAVSGAVPGAYGATPRQVESASAITLPTVTPVDNSVELHTHIATITVDATIADAPTLNLVAEYDLRNEGSEAMTVAVRLPAPLPPQSELSVDGVPLTLESADGDQLGATFSIPAGEQVEMVLDTTQPLGPRGLASVLYPVATLRAWSGQRSTRIDLLPGSGLPQESWLTVAPDSWEYAPPAVATTPAMEWLYEGELPDAIRFVFVAPATWAAIQAAQSSANSGAVNAYAELGQLYAGLAVAAAQAGNAPIDERFFGQALAAYTEGIRRVEATDPAPAAVAPYHAGLASLYRTRAIRADGTTDPIYVELMAAEAGAALQGTMADELRRPELESWQAEGLRLLLSDARRRGDIPGALALIDRVAASPAGGASADFLAQERNALIVQQAVQLLEQGDRDTALALAGASITDPALQPPDDRLSLFARWTISTTVTNRSIELVADIIVNDERAADAAAALESTAANWRQNEATRSIEISLAELPGGQDGPTAYRLTIRLPAGATGVALAEALPVRADWVLLRVLLGQLGPKIESASRLVWEQVHMTQPIDLRSAGEQWAIMASDLETQANSLEVQITTGNGETATLPAAQEARIRAANYRHAAQQWRALANDSQVFVGLTIPGGLSNAARAWLGTVANPPQTLDVQVETLSAGRLLLVTLIAGMALFGLAVLLWRLL